MNIHISVIMAAYNEEKTIRPTIESVLNQTFKDFEYVIIDDGSKDGTFHILEEYAKKDPRIRLIKNEKNRGITKTMRIGVENCTGDYIAVIDCADLCDHTRLEKQAAFLDNNPKVYVAGCYHHWINKKGEIIDSYTFPTDPKKIRSHIFGFGAVAAHPCLMIRKELFKKTGPYDSSIKTSMDYELYMRTLASGFDLSNVPEYLVSVLRREEGISLSKNKQIFIDMFVIRMRYLPKMFSIKNLLYTVASFFLILVPRSLLRRIVCSSLWSKKIRNLAIKC